MAYRLLPTLAVVLALYGCGALDRRPEPASPGTVLGTASAGASVESSHEVRPAAAGASVKPSHEVRPADRLSNLSLHVYGLSYHTDREGARRRNVDNELNPGLGLGYEFHNDDRGVAFFAAGFYEDSGRSLAKLAGPGYQFKLGNRWRLGAVLPVIQSRTYNNGRAFIVPIPLLTYDLGAVRLNAVYAPRYGQHNEFAVFGLYLSIPFRK